MKNDKSLFRLKLFFITLCLLLLLTSCEKKDESNQKGIAETVTSTLPATAQSTIETPEIRKTIYPTITNTLPYEKWVTIEATQMPIKTITTSWDEEGLIYNNVVIVFTFDANTFTDGYINLDNLNDNGLDNSDIVLSSAVGNDYPSFDLYSANNSLMYLSNRALIDYQYCSFGYHSLPMMTKLEYALQSRKFVEGLPYCIYTNENHIAIVNYLADSMHFNDDHSFDISLAITVFTDGYGE